MKQIITELLKRLKKYESNATCEDIEIEIAENTRNLVYDILKELKLTDDDIYNKLKQRAITTQSTLLIEHVLQRLDGKNVFVIELDDYDTHTITYTMQHVRKEEEYLQRAIKLALEKIVNQMREQLENNIVQDNSKQERISQMITDKTQDVKDGTIYEKDMTDILAQEILDEILR